MCPSASGGEEDDKLVPSESLREMFLPLEKKRAALQFGIAMANVCHISSPCAQPQASASAPIQHRDVPDQGLKQERENIPKILEGRGTWQKGHIGHQYQILHSASLC